jgi:hypothetical protein
LAQTESSPIELQRGTPELGYSLAACRKCSLDENQRSSLTRKAHQRFPYCCFPEQLNLKLQSLFSLVELRAKLLVSHSFALAFSTPHVSLIRPDLSFHEAGEFPHSVFNRVIIAKVITKSASIENLTELLRVADQKKMPGR